MNGRTIVLLAAFLPAQGHVTAVQKEEIPWQGAPGLSAGIQSSVIWGDPERGAYQAMIKFPAGVEVAPHYHAHDEFATVVSGSVLLGQGGQVDPAQATEVSAGGYFTIPAGTAHWARGIRDAVIVRFSPGPREMTAIQAGQKAPGAGSIRIVQAKDAPWTDAPGMVSGVKTVLQYGDPAKGPYLILLKFPKGLFNPAHYHTADEVVTILSGTMITGEGETRDDAQGKPVAAGGYFLIPGRTPHWGRVPQDEVILTRLGVGPRDIFYFEAKK